MRVLNCWGKIAQKTKSCKLRYAKCQKFARRDCGKELSIFSKVGAAALCHFLSPSASSSRIAVAATAVVTVEPVGGEGSYTTSVATLPVVNKGDLSSRRCFSIFLLSKRQRT